MICDSSIGPYDEVINIFNNLDSHIKFTASSSSQSQIFLDVKIYKVSDTLRTDIYYKTTDSHNFLHFYSNHPRKCKRNLPYALARRIQRIVSNDTTVKIKLEELRQQRLLLKLSLIHI